MVQPAIFQVKKGLGWRLINYLESHINPHGPKEERISVLSEDEDAAFFVIRNLNSYCENSSELVSVYVFPISSISNLPPAQGLAATKNMIQPQTIPSKMPHPINTISRAINENELQIPTILDPTKPHEERMEQIGRTVVPTTFQDLAISSSVVGSPSNKQFSCPPDTKFTVTGINENTFTFILEQQQISALPRHPNMIFRWKCKVLPRHMSIKNQLRSITLNSFAYYRQNVSEDPFILINELEKRICTILEHNLTGNITKRRKGQWLQCQFRFKLFHFPFKHLNSMLVSFFYNSFWEMNNNVLTVQIKSDVVTPDVITTSVYEFLTSRLVELLFERNQFERVFLPLDA